MHKHCRSIHTFLKFKTSEDEYDSSLSIIFLCQVSLIQRDGSSDLISEVIDKLLQSLGLPRCFHTAFHILVTIFAIEFMNKNKMECLGLRSTCSQIVITVYTIFTAAAILTCTVCSFCFCFHYIRFYKKWNLNKHVTDVQMEQECSIPLRT